jgi:hypothetical protein
VAISQPAACGIVSLLSIGSARGVDVDIRSLDRRTRRDDDVGFVAAEDFFADVFPALAERHRLLLAKGAEALEAPPLTLLVDGLPYRLEIVDEKLTARSGGAGGGLTVRLDASLFSDLAQQLQSFSAMMVAGVVRPEGGSPEDLESWDSLWLCLLEGCPVVDSPLTFNDRHGAPLDLQRHFTPDDDPANVAHFLREAGYLHLRGWADPEVMTQIAADIDRALPLYAPDDGKSWWATTGDGARRCVRLQHFVQHSPATAALLSGDRWQQLRRTMAADDELVQAPIADNIIEALVKPLGVVEGISDVPWHRDCEFGRHAYQCTGTVIGISVTAGDADSGQLRAVAGSHRLRMPANRASRDPYLPVVPLPTRPGDLTVHLPCTLHEAQPPLKRERLVMYTGFGLPARSVEKSSSARRLADLRERAHKLKSQPPSPVAAASS